MTDNQIKYHSYCKRSKSLCMSLENLIEEADYHEKLFNYNAQEALVIEIANVRGQLDAIWTIQVDLFFMIQEDFKRERQQHFAVLDDAPARLKKSKKTIEQSRPASYKIHASKLPPSKR